MINLKHINIYTLAAVLSASFCFGYTLDHCDNNIDESCTLSYRAEALYGAATPQDIQRLANDAVKVSYDVYAPNYTRFINEEIGRLRGMGLGESDIASAVYVRYSKSLAETVINQTASLSSKLTPIERNTFWDCVASAVKSHVNAFCQKAGGKPTADINQHVDNLIKMKKMFG